MSTTRQVARKATKHTWTTIHSTAGSKQRSLFLSIRIRVPCESNCFGSGGSKIISSYANSGRTTSTTATLSQLMGSRRTCKLLLKSLRIRSRRASCSWTSGQFWLRVASSRSTIKSRLNQRTRSNSVSRMKRSRRAQWSRKRTTWLQRATRMTMHRNWRASSPRAPCMRARSTPQTSRNWPKSTPPPRKWIRNANYGRSINTSLTTHRTKAVRRTPPPSRLSRKD